MTDYTIYIHKIFNEVENSGPCADCKHRDTCWKDSGKVIKAAIQGEREKDATRAADAYEKNLSGKLCTDGKDMLIWLLLLSMYMMDNPPPVMPWGEHKHE